MERVPASRGYGRRHEGWPGVLRPIVLRRARVACRACTRSDSSVHTGGGQRVDDWPAFARRVEELGYAALYVTDHLGRQLAPIAALATAAAATSTLRLGSYVFANDFRHPLILAREAATLDRLSGGRLDLGLGRRLDAVRLPAARACRTTRPGAASTGSWSRFDILDRLFAGETVTHHGPSTRSSARVLFPAPIQRPRPPLIMLVAAGPRLLRHRRPARRRSSGSPRR